MKLLLPEIYIFILPLQMLCDTHHGSLDIATDMEFSFLVLLSSVLAISSVSNRDTLFEMVHVLPIQIFVTAITGLSFK